MRVWVDDWQMKCCGTPFAEGTSVEWTLSEKDMAWLTDVLGAETARSVDFSEVHCDVRAEDAPVIRGVVTGICASYCRFAARGSGRVLKPVPGSGRLSVVHHADGWEPETDDLSFNGYIVDLAVETGPTAR